MQKKENQRIILTKRLLKEAFLEMFKTTPIDKIHIRTLCDNAGINRSTFYKYYKKIMDNAKKSSGVVIANNAEIIADALKTEKETARV